MNKKILVIAFLGIILGGIGGYGYSTYGTSPKIQTLYFQIIELKSEIQELDRSLEDQSDQYTLLSDAYDSLSAKHNTITSRYSALSNNYNTLTNDFDELEDQYNELEVNHEELLGKYELAVASLPLSPIPISPEIMDVDFTWYFEGRKYTLSLSIPESHYQYYQEKERIETEDYSVYVTHPYDDEYLNAMILKFNFIALERGYSEEEKINLVIAFVQSLPYTSDSVTTPYDEYPRYPLETLIDNGGDCEDTSILVASLLKAMNYDVILIDLTRHMAVAVCIDTYGSYYTVNDKEYFYLETTSTGWEIGEMPDDYRGTSVYIYELNPIPICTHGWTAKYKGSKLEVKVTVTNEGTAMAFDILVYVAFEADEGYVWNPEESDPFDLNVGNSIDITLLLDPPSNKHTRLIVGVVDAEGYYIDKSYSSWIDT